MGNSVVKAKNAAADEKESLDTLVAALQNRLDAFELEVQAKRGNEAAENPGEVQGGRSVSRISEIRVSDGAGIDDQITGAIENFFQAATNSIGGDDNGAKQSAVDGAKNLISAGLNALFGPSAGQSVTKRSFIVLFLNNAFCRIDYYAYSYNVSAKIWGAEANSSGVCYIADLSVLKTDLLTPNEIDYLLSQALSVSNAEFDKLNRLKIALIESAILSRALQNESLTFPDLQEIAEELVKSQKAINEAFQSMDTYVSPFKSKEEDDEQSDPKPPVQKIGFS